MYNLKVCQQCRSKIIILTHVSKTPSTNHVINNSWIQWVNTMKLEINNNQHQIFWSEHRKRNFSVLKHLKFAIKKHSELSQNHLTVIINYIQYSIIWIFVFLFLGDISCIACNLKHFLQSENPSTELLHQIWQNVQGLIPSINFKPWLWMGLVYSLGYSIKSGREGGQRENN